MKFIGIAGNVVQVAALLMLFQDPILSCEYCHALWHVLSAVNLILVLAFAELMYFHGLLTVKLDRIK
jgi:hypothetical protein